MTLRLQDAARSGVNMLRDQDMEALENLKIRILKNTKRTIPDGTVLTPGEFDTGMGEEKEEKIAGTGDFLAVVQYLRKVKNLTYLEPKSGGDSTRYRMDEKYPNMIRYAYILSTIPNAPDQNIVQFLADADYDYFDYNGNGQMDESEEPTPAGTLFNISKFKALREAFNGKVSADSDYTEDAWGVLISGYAPIKNKQGKIIGVLGLDMRADNEYNTVRYVFWLYIIIVALSAVFSIALAFFLSRLLTRPLDALREGAERVMNKDFQTSISLNTGDEMSMLAETFNRMVDEIRIFSENLQRQNEAFFRFVPNEFVQTLGGNSAVDIGVGNSKSSRMSIMFTDIRSFTSFSEGRTPEDTFGFLNEYLGRMEPSIKKAGGFIDKFLGDGILALFQSDEKTSTAEERAVESAIRMRQVLTDFNRERAEKELPAIDFGVGISSGQVILGTVGSLSRLDTTVIGTPVNMASRLEGLTALYHLPILICEDTLAGLHDPEKYHIREVDTVIVKGSSKPIGIFEVYDADSESLRNCKDKSKHILNQGIVHYKLGGFQQALETFQKALQICPEDRLIKIYIKRCKKYLENPPSEEWLGAIQITRK